MSLQTRIESLALATVMGLPESVQRRLGGRPLRLDGQTLAADLQVMLRLQQLARKGDLGGSSIAAGRAGMLANARLAGGTQPIGRVRDLRLADLPARLYTPTGAASGPAPLLIFFHGGGFLYGDLDSHDAPCRVLAERSGVAVLSVEYGLGPEAPFPRGFDDAVAALRWVHENPDEVDADPARLGVSGDSAGGNIAAWVAIAAAREGLPLAAQVLLYPCTDPDRQTESLRLFGEGLYLTAEAMKMFNDAYLLTPEDEADERVNLLDVELPDGLARAYVATAGFDPLRDEGEAYAARLADAGVPTEVRRFEDQIHGFVNIVGVGRSSRAGVEEIAGVVRRMLRG